MSEDLKLLKSFNKEIEAEMAKELLSNEGIPSMILSDDAGHMYPQFQTISKGVRLLVSPQDFDRAKDALGIMDASEES